VNLAPKALQALVDIKRELLVEPSSEAEESEPRPMREEKPRSSHVMRPARVRARPFQRMCQGRFS